MCCPLCLFGKLLSLLRLVGMFLFCDTVRRSKPALFTSHLCPKVRPFTRKLWWFLLNQRIVLQMMVSTRKPSFNHTVSFNQIHIFFHFNPSLTATRMYKNFIYICKIFELKAALCVLHSLRQRVFFLNI